MVPPDREHHRAAYIQLLDTTYVLERMQRMCLIFDRVTMNTLKNSGNPKT